MSRSGRRLEQFYEVRRRRRDPSRQEQKTTLKDRVVIWGVLLLGLIALLGTPILHLWISHRNLIHDRVGRWRSELGLSEQEASRLLEVEFSFHGSGSPFAPETPRSPSEEAAHTEELVSAVDSPRAVEFRKILARRHSH